jgi:hypothetical protein
MAESCPHHERIAADVERQQRWIADVQDELHAHARNGGSGHVSRAEFDKLSAEVAAMKALGLKLIIGVLIASGGGSALAPTLLKLLGG